MSHARERAEKICLNCNAELHGKYCHVCGQENIDPRESIWSIVTHFFNDITHFDGKFFKTVGTLIAKPGFLPLEYLNGRRARYLHPIRLYVFTSAIFFLIFYNYSAPDFSASASREVKPGEIPSVSDVILNPIDSIAAINQRENDYKTIAEYDSIQRTLPESERDNWITRKVTERNILRTNKYNGRGDLMLSSVLDNFLHTFPYLLFASLPICAFFLQILYFRNRNNVYSGNAIFLVYLYVFSFIMLLVYLLISSIESAYHLRWLEWFKILLFLYVSYYTAKAMKRYYQQGRFVTVLKFIAFNILSLAAIIFLFIVFLVLSILKV